jgi:hypothetical protein
MRRLRELGSAAVVFGRVAWFLCEIKIERKLFVYKTLELDMGFWV